MLCDCSNLDWTGCDMTALHHPACPVIGLATRPYDYLKPMTTDEMLARIPAPPVYRVRLVDAKGNVLEEGETDSTTYRFKSDFNLKESQFVTLTITNQSVKYTAELWLGPCRINVLKFGDTPLV